MSETCDSKILVLLLGVSSIFGSTLVVPEELDLEIDEEVEIGPDDLDQLL